MTINSVKEQEPVAPERPPITVQNDIQKEIQKEILTQTLGTEGTQKQVLQLLASAQPTQQIQQTAQSQIKQGYVDVKV